MRNDLEAIYGKPVRREDTYVARKRFHQSWYRHRVLRIGFAAVPGHGNYLLDEDARDGKNFLTPEIAVAARKRFPLKQGTVGRNRLYGNMLSSQPLCFNLFAPLGNNPDLARRFLEFLLPGRSLENIKVELEASTLTNVLGDRTAFDALIRYESGGTPGFIGIETKYSEPFSTTLGKGLQARYRKWFDPDQGWWRAGTYDALLKARYQQLWRNHMLALALGASRPEYGSGELIVLHAPDDPYVRKAFTEYEATLAEHTPKPRTIPLDRLIAGWQTIAPDEATRAWLDGFNERYLDLPASEAEWQRYSALD